MYTTVIMESKTPHSIVSERQPVNKQNHYNKGRSPWKCFTDYIVHVIPT